LDILKSETAIKHKLFESLFEMIDDPAIIFLPDRSPVGNSAYSKAFPGWQFVYRFGQELNDKVKTFWRKYIKNIEEVSRQIWKLRETHEKQEAVWYFNNGSKLEFKAEMIEFEDGSFAELWVSRDVTELYDTEILFNTIYNIMYPAIAVFTDGTIIANDAYYEVFPDWEIEYTDILGRVEKNGFAELEAYWNSMIVNADEYIEAVKRLRNSHMRQTVFWRFRDGGEYLQKGYWLDLRDKCGELWVMNDVEMLFEEMKKAKSTSLDYYQKVVSKSIL
jgi:hypothetical protein